MYTGYKTIVYDTNELAHYYQEGLKCDLEFKPNEYLIIQDTDGNIIDYYKPSNKGFEKVKFPKIESNFGGVIKPRNPEQYVAIDMLKDKSIPVKLITGKFGTGKTLLCVTAALEALEKGRFEKIMFVRNNVQVKDTVDLGALPGDEIDKTLPYVMPFADHCGGVDGLKYLITSGKLEVVPLAFIRGRSIKNSILYSMESENLTKEHIQLILGRIDTGSELWMDGDLKQRDKVSFDKSKGLETMVERLQDSNLFGYVNLVKTERSEVAALADLLDN